MLVSQIIEDSFPHVYVTDKVSFALHLMEDYNVQHLAIEANDKFEGLISKDILHEHDEDAFIAELEDQFIHASVAPHEHFLSALKMVSGLGDISLIPVVSETKEMLGVITAKKLIHSAATFYAVEEPGGMIVLEMERRNFSFGEISRLVETNDAYITQLNTYVDANTGILQATIKVNKIEISDIIATFQRYDYNVLYYFGEEIYENELKENLDLLMAYLNI
jgi:CBS domain-containing protein